MTVRAKTTAASNAGSFAPEHRVESGVELLVEDPAGHPDWDDWNAVVEEQQALVYLRGVLATDAAGTPPHVVPPRDQPRHPINECTGADLPRMAFLGKDAYDPELVAPIRNIIGFSKPEGGTWLAPLHEDGTTDWTRWCARARYDSALKDRRIHPIGLHPAARVLKIDSHADLQAVIDAHGGVTRDDQVRPDFEEVARHYDALWLTRRGMNQTSADPHRGYGVGENLDLWDVESIVVLRPDAVHAT